MRPLRGFDGVFGMDFGEGELLRVLGRRSLPEPGGVGGVGLREKEMTVVVRVMPEWCFPATMEVEEGMEEFG